MNIRAQKTVVTVLLSSFLLASCGGGGSSSPSSETPAPTSTAAKTSADMIESMGSPAMFSVECGRLAYNKNTESWDPQSGFVRIETWIYSNASGAEVVSIANGEVVDRTLTNDDHSQYPGPNIDPRRFGCAEQIATVERVLGGTQSLTTDGSDAEAELNLGNIQLKVIYYTINNAESGMQVTYSNDQMIGMVTL